MSDEPTELTEEQLKEFHNWIEQNKNKLNVCKTPQCRNGRRNGSAYCQECSDKHNAKLQ